LYREGLAASLGRDGRLDVIDLVGGKEALARVLESLPDIVLLDGAMAHCLPLARRIRAEWPNARIVGFGISGGADQLVACAESGLAAFVDCNGSVSELVEAVQGALKGELACSPQVSALLCERLASLANAGGLGRETLTRREREIAALIGEGLSNKEIAIDLRIGPSTVKNHIHNILEKLNVRRRAAIVHQLREFPWIKSSSLTDS
jgi:DNA-binding NarL/FixJ family response regulator